MRKRYGFFSSCCCFFFSIGAALALAVESPILFSPAQTTYTNWVFSGIVTDERGDHYDYVFQMQRQGALFHVTVALFDAQTKQSILTADEQATLDAPERYDWRVGHTFLRFNPINASWILGLKTDEKTGFNFKIDMLRRAEDIPVTHDLRQGLAFMVSQTGQLNGHIQLPGANSEQFVTGRNAWFRQISSSQTVSPDVATMAHQLQGVLCRFDDGSGFYAMNTFATDAILGATAGWLDAAGVSLAVSQFINVKQETDGPWHIRIPSPNTHYVLTDTTQQNAWVTGFIAEKDKQGFCMLSQEAVA